MRGGYDVLKDSPDFDMLRYTFPENAMCDVRNCDGG